MKRWVEPENLRTAGARGMTSFSSDSSLTVSMCVGGWVCICYVSVLFKPEVGDLLWVAGLWLVASIWYCSRTVRQPWEYANKRVRLCSSKTLMKRETWTGLWAIVGLIIESGLSVPFRWSHAMDAFSLPLLWLISIDASITANGLLTCLVIPSLSLEDKFCGDRDVYSFVQHPAQKGSSMSVWGSVHASTHT